MATASMGGGVRQPPPRPGPGRRPRARRCVASAEPALAAPAAELPGVLELAPGPPPTEWELDFCSRPLLDARGKRLWELLVTSPDGALRYAEIFPNNKINSAELAASLQRLASAPGLARPSRVRYFRAQMGTIISRAASALLAGAPATPSRRCVAVQAWLAERCASHYPQQVGYDPNAPPLARLDPGAPLPLPDALRGERWAFVSAPAALVGDQAARVRAGAAFGAVFPVSPASAVPGVVVFSSRALALAGWMNGLELGCVAPDARTGALLLETGVAQRWAYASWRRSAAADAEANAWAQAKKDAGGLHFLAVQRDEGDDVQGFWLMREFEGL